MGQQVHMADLGGDDFDLDIPGLEEANAERTHARLAEIAPNPLNPREDLGELSDLTASMREMGQIQAIAVVTRAAYLRQYPEHEETIGAAAFVAITGARRLAAAEKAGVDLIDIVVNDEIAERRDRLAAVAIAENLERTDLGPLEEAKAVQQLVELCKTQDKAAKRLGRSQGYISQRLKLLRLSGQMRTELKDGRLSVEDARRLASLPHEEQYDTWQAEQAALRRNNPAEKSESRPDGEHAAPAEPEPSPRAVELEGWLSERFDTRATVKLGKSKGKITLEFGSLSDLERIVELLDKHSR